MKLIKEPVVGEKDPYWRNAAVICGIGFLIVILFFGLIWLISGGSWGDNPKSSQKRQCNTVYQKGGVEQEICNDDDLWYEHYVEEAERNMERERDY